MFESMVGQLRPMSTVSTRLAGVRSPLGSASDPAKWSLLSGRSRRGVCGWLTHRVWTLPVSCAKRGEEWRGKARKQLPLRRNPCGCRCCHFSLSTNTTLQTDGLHCGGSAAMEEPAPRRSRP